MLALAIAALSTSSNPSYFLHYFKEPRELRHNPALIAIQDPASTTPIPGWRLAPASTPHPTAFSSPVFYDNLGGPMFATPFLLLGLQPPFSADRALALVRELDPAASLDTAYPNLPGIYRIALSTTDGSTVLSTANALALRPETSFAEPDMAFSGQAALLPNDPNFPSCWGLRNTGQSGGLPGFDMDAAPAWDITTGDPSIITVIIDTGVDQSHPDLNLRTGTDTTGQGGGGNPVNSCDNHGTAVAGCVSARINNSLGTVGIAPASRSASARTFISTTACDGGWNSQASWTVASLDWALSISARVSNNSNLYGFTSAAIASSYTSTRTAGIVHFACAGNNSTGSLAYPSSLPTVNAVAATARNGTRAGFSNWGPGLDFSAPGASIASTDRTGALGYTPDDYATVSGTSFATPYTAGVAALVLSLYPSLSSAQVESILQLSADDMTAPGYDTDTGWGHVNAYRALRAACPADFDKNGTTDFFDYLDFAAAFDAANLTADFNGDRQVDFFDYLDFVAAFAQGC
jgi:subtilisin family serine protease